MTNPLVPRSWLTLVLATALSGCASVTPPSAVSDAGQRHTTVLPAATELGLTQGVPSRNWWLALQDAPLNALVQHAMDKNHDRQAALAAVRQARAAAGLAAREGGPSGSLGAQTQSVRPSIAEVDPYDQGLPRPPTQRLATLAQVASWEIDLFGRVGTATAVAERQADAIAADAHAAEALLQAEVVRQYVRLRLAQSDQAWLQTEVATLQDHERLLQARAQAGLSDPREARAATAQVARAQALQALTQASLMQARNALAVLVGRAPADLDANESDAGHSDWSRLLAPAPLPPVPDHTHVVNPTDLLARRPDVVRADAQLRAALGEAVLAERAHLPRLSLSATFGLNGTFGTLGQSGAQRRAAGAALQWDWLDAGRMAARAAAARAGGDVAWHHFEQTVLQALQDSDNALRTWQAAQQSWQQGLRAQTAVVAATQHAQTRAQAGLEPPTQALEHTARSLEAQRTTAALQADALQAYAQVQLALAAWQTDPPSTIKE